MAFPAARAQEAERDSLLDEVLVTATRGAGQLGGLAVPSDVIAREDIEVRGAARLGDLLAGFGGYTTVSEFGTGVQVQGLGPDYTLILVDGEPVIGRLNGTLDLDRLGLQDVERVEIVRGPFSSLYGSDALAGVINLITRTPREALRGVGSLRVESDGSADAGTEMSMRAGAFAGGLSLRHYRSSAYDLDRSTPSPTLPAYSGSDASLRLDADLPMGFTVGLRGRVGIEDQREGRDVSLPAGSAPLTGQGLRNDWSLSTSIARAITPTARAAARLYTSRYRTETQLSATSGDTLDSRFEQAYHKGEIQVEGLLGASHLLTTGVGGVLESVDADRIGGGQRNSRAAFAFLQEQWIVSPRVELTASARLDAPSDYASRLSPAAAILVRPATGALIRASFGSGFKAPTFQQRYLDFTNAAAGYTVIGATDVESVLAGYESEGLIERYENTQALSGVLRPEISRAANVGAEVAVGQVVTMRANAFYNRVSDLIEILPVATLTNGRQVYTYVNLDRVRTRGMELGAEWRPATALHLALRYQYLDAADLGTIDDIAAGRVFTRDTDGRDRVLEAREYGGLFGRSPHSGSIELRWTAPVHGLTFSARGVYRSRYGDFDRNGNLVLDDAGEYVRGHALVHATATYAVRDWLTLQAGVDNALDYTDPARVPSLPGRRWFGGIRLSRARS